MASGRKANQGSGWISKGERFAIYHRDGFTCVYCGDAWPAGPMLTLDHVTPTVYGGESTPKNLVACCHVCNSVKSHAPRSQFLTYLRRRGRDTANLARRVRRALARAINLDEGRRLAKEAKANRGW